MGKRGRKLSAKLLTKLEARVFCFVIGSYQPRSLLRETKTRGLHFWNHPRLVMS